MNILLNDGDFVVLAHTTPTNFETDDLMEIVKKAATTCYQSEQKTHKNPQEFAKMLLGRGHMSMFDHVHVTVLFKNVSRGFTHELVRHRIAAYAQESTRYVDPGNIKVVGPPHRNLDEQITIETNLDDGSIAYKEITFREMVKEVERFYRGLRNSGWSQEDARQILPIGIKSEIVMTADLTEWRHTFRLRTQKAAHWEIRGVMNKLLKHFKEVFPPVFDDFIIAGKDENELEYYKIKGYVGDITKMVNQALEQYVAENTLGNDQASHFANYLNSYYNQNY